MEIIKDAIRKRIERFNRLWKKETGHTFEEDVDYCQNLINEWIERLNKRLNELCYKSFEEYNEKLYDQDLSDEERDKLVDSELEELRQSKPLHSIYLYEISCINQAERICDFLRSKNEDLKAAWETYAKDGGTFYDLINRMKADGFTGWSNDHSGNSAGASGMFAHCLIYRPEAFPYVHGALAYLVGDKGYHDDRSDIPENF